MQIVYVIERISGTGGLQHILIDKMNYLAEHTAFKVVLMTIWHDDVGAAYPLNEKIKRVNLDVPLMNIQFGYVLGLPLALFKFNKCIREINPDITVFFRAVGAFLAATTSWKGRMLFESHSAYMASNHRWLYPYMQSKVDAIVCLTRGDAENFKKTKHVEVIPNFTTICSTTSIDYSVKKLIFVGRDCPEKDIPRLKRLWSIVSKKYPSWQLKIHNSTKDVVKAYTEGSIFLMTSKAEGFGLVIVEAMRCGLPCVAFDCPYGPADIIEDGKTGYLIPYNDDQAFIDKLSTLMDNEELRRKMGEAAKEASMRYKPEPIMQQWLELFSNMTTLQ